MNTKLLSVFTNLHGMFPLPLTLLDAISFKLGPVSAGSSLVYFTDRITLGQTFSTEMSGYFVVCSAAVSSSMQSLQP